MTRKDKAARIQKVLSDLYPLPPVPLHHRDPYTLLIAVLLSAQCTDVRVNQVAPRLFAQAETPEAMARLGVRQIETIIRPCGLAPAKPSTSAACPGSSSSGTPARCRELRGARAAAGRGTQDGERGHGPGFGEPAFPVDTHIHRLAARWGLSSGQSVEATERDLKRLYPPAAWSTLHLQIIYVGREHCPARSHAFDECPICSWAASRRHVVRERARRSAPRRSTPAGARRR